MTTTGAARERLRCFLVADLGVDGLAIQEGLEKLGVDVIASEDMPSATSLATSIRESVRGANFVCVVPASDTPSAAVVFEAGLAIGIGKPVVLVTNAVSDVGLIELSGSPVIRYRSVSDSYLWESLQAYVERIGSAAALISRPISPEDKPNAPSWRIVPPPPRRIAGKLERQVAHTLEGSGAIVAVKPPLPDRIQVDFAVSFSNLGDAFNPVLIEVKSKLSGDRNVALRQLRAALQKVEGQLGVLVSGAPLKRATSFEGSTGILIISLQALEQLGRLGTIEDELIRLRNQFVHRPR